MAAQMIRPAAPIQNLANQFADWANMRVAATEEEKKGDEPDANEEEKKWEIKSIDENINFT